MTSDWDDFSKALADDSLPRRDSLRRIGLLITATVLSPLGVEFARAGHQTREPKPQPPRTPKPTPPKSPKDPCQAFCSCSNSRQKDQCLKACKACANDARRLAGACGAYICCGAGMSVCKGACADLAFDRLNCGACGYECPEPGQYEEAWCFDGVCQSGCEPGAVNCDGACRFLDYDRDNCGACGHVCPSGTICVSGDCYDAGTPCAGGGTLCNGVCTNTAFDTLNCGACGHVCDDFQTCSGGICDYLW